MEEECMDVDPTCETYGPGPSSETYDPGSTCETYGPGPTCETCGNVKQLSCPHFISLKSEVLLTSYEILHAFYVSCVTKENFERKKDLICENCENSVQYARMYACLSCIYYGCLDHTRLHAAENDHPLAVNTDFGGVYCSACDDYQYDFNLTEISQKLNILAYRKRGPSCGITFKWEPNQLDIEVLQQHEVVFDSKTDMVNGLINMGNVCFMNVIIQTFIHAPFFRDYLLSYKHTCLHTEEEAKLSSEKERSKLLPDCYVCEMTRIIQKCFSGTQQPATLDNLLRLHWTRILESYGDFVLTVEDKQQIAGQADAYDFFSSLLENLHVDCIKSTGGSFIIEPSDETCKCVIHTTFGFILNSVKTCKTCGNVVTLDTPYWDITLGHADESAPTLSDLLWRYFQEEEIEDYKCAVCPEKTIASSRLYIKKLPLVISICLNERNLLIEYKEFLDLSPFVYGTENSDSTHSDYSFRYFLFAVVQHMSVEATARSRSKSKRNINTDSPEGHYVCYVRQNKDNWILCNDQKVIPVGDIKNVLKTQARMLFYHRMSLPVIQI